MTEQHNMRIVKTVFTITLTLFCAVVHVATNENTE